MGFLLRRSHSSKTALQAVKSDVIPFTWRIVYISIMLLGGKFRKREPKANKLSRCQKITKFDFNLSRNISVMQLRFGTRNEGRTLPLVVFKSSIKR